MRPEREHRPDIEPEIRPNFGVINGGGESTDERGDLKAAASNPDTTSRKLASGEKKFGVIQGGGESTDERGDLHDAEQDAGLKKDGLFVHDPQKPQKADVVKAKGIAKKYGGIFGLISILGVSGGIIATLFAPAGMIIHLMENMTFTNDTSSTAFERRFFRVFANMTKETDPVCANGSKKMKCKMGRISNSALRTLANKGVVGVFPDGTEAGTKRTGYPKENPKSYRIDLGGGKSETVPADELVQFLIDNPKHRAKVLGVKGAFKLHIKAWSGKHVSKNLYDRYGLKRDGGLADGQNKPMTAAERVVAAREKLQEGIPSLEEATDGAGTDTSEGGLKDTIKAKAEKHLGKAKKGGAAYTVAVASCIAVKAPEYVAAGVAGAQVVQVMAPVMDDVLSPASKAKADGIDGTKFTAEDMETVATPLTEKVDGKSALDSKMLKAAIGVEKGNVGASEFAPGYSILSNSVVKKSRKASQKTQSACNGVMSNTAMYSAMAVNSAATVAASSTVIGGIIKVVIDFAAGEIAGKVVGKAMENLAAAAINDLAKNDRIPTARGEALGDVMGVGAMTFFSAGGMSRHLPTLKMTQLESYENVHRENEKSQREMDIATLSPFDTSSRYTFLGSIANNVRNTAIMSGGYGLGSVISGIIRSPGIVFSSTAGAATGFSSSYCGHAKEYGLETEDAKDTPAINAAGLPCTGLTEQQAGMNTDSARERMEDEEWIDGNADIADDASIDDLVESGVIKDDTPLSDFIQDCSNASTGNYLFNSAGCTTNSDTKQNGGIAANLGENGCEGEGDERVCIDPNESVKGVKSADSMAAQAPFLVDYQLLQTVNGEDEEPEAQTTVSGDPMSITVASYNMCQEVNHPTCPSQDTKNQKITSVFEGSAGLTSTPLDIVGAQEISQKTQSDLTASLSNYDSYPEKVPENNGKAIFWNTTKFTFQNGSRLTGVVGNGTSDSIDNNSFPWVKLTSTSGQNVYVMSVHSPNNSFGSPADRYQNVQKIREWSDSKSADGSLVIITGDFNNGARQDGGNPGAYCYLTENGKLQHARDAVTKPGSSGCQGDSVPIDQIYASTNITGMKASGWGHTSDSNQYATDHSPAYVTYTTPGSGSDAGGSDVGGSVGGDDYAVACAAGKSLGAPCNGECVSFVKYRLLKNDTKYNGGTLGNGKDVVGTLAGLGYQTGSVARVGSVFSTSQTSTPQWGHTGIVSQVNPDGSIVIEEYNFTNDHAYGTRTMTQAQYQAKGYTFAYVGLTQ